MIAKIHTSQTVGLNANIIDVETDISNGLHSFNIVGLPDKSIEEAKDRIVAAIKNSGFVSPQKGNKKIIVSLAPADIKKEGSQFDVAIALSYLVANEEIAFDPEKRLFLGELGLDGSIRPIRGTLILAKHAKQKGFKEIFVPKQNALEAALIDGIKIFPTTNLLDLINHLLSETQGGARIDPIPHQKPVHKKIIGGADFEDIRGQESAKRGLIIAAAGRHNVAMSGPPGTGKTMLARAFAGILPALSFEEMLEVTAIHSVAGLMGENFITEPPFRSPHHTASYVALIGGGKNPKPGEISLAHKGVLFLDEFPEYERRLIESLRQPLEDRLVTVSRAQGTVTYPTHFILVATMNPCPCGFLGADNRRCTCMPSTLERYKRKISGPIIDRIDLWLDVPKVEYSSLSEKNGGTSTKDAKEKIERARKHQRERFSGKDKTNSEMNVRDLEHFANLSKDLRKTLDGFAEKLDLSARAYHRIIKLARTIADLEDSPEITEPHILEALQYRPKNN